MDDTEKLNAKSVLLHEYMHRDQSRWKDPSPYPRSGALRMLRGSCHVMLHYCL